MKYKILVILFFVFYKSFSCSCSQLSLIDKVKAHDYIAKIKITESKTVENFIDSFNPYFVKIETVNKKTIKSNDLEKVIIKEVKELSKRLSNFKRPTSIIVSKEALPRTATRKVKRKEIKEEYDRRND
jgi:acyl-CoA synthetase (AMP-forming)/AMP-acid ligase II